MKPPLKLLISFLAFGLAAAPFVRALDDPPTITVPVPAAPDASNDTPAPANKAKGGARRGPMMDNIKVLKEKLNLTSDQDKQIGGIIKSHVDDFKAARGDRAKLLEIQKQQHSEIRAALNPDQQKTFDEMTAANRAKGKGKKKDI
jgi:hypothetical protein